MQLSAARTTIKKMYKLLNKMDWSDYDRMILCDDLQACSEQDDIELDEKIIKFITKCEKDFLIDA